MKVKPSIIDNLAEMICGDETYNEYFPYRSSWYLTRFFRDIDLEYAHDGSTRKWWVVKVLSELNDESNSDPDLPSSTVINVIEYLLDFSHFSDFPDTHDIAIEKVNKILRKQNLIVEKDETTNDVILHKVIEGYISTSTRENIAKKVITFSPSVFETPDKHAEANLVSVMMPFEINFDKVLETIKAACSSVGMDCKRVDDIWNNSSIIQDIFELIYCSSIVVVDFTGKNSNVFYETGIAHTLGKHVIPITQHIDDIPFDLRHHRAIEYLNNVEGREVLKGRLESRLKTLIL